MAKKDKILIAIGNRQLKENIDIAIRDSEYNISSADSIESLQSTLSDTKNFDVAIFSTECLQKITKLDKNFRKAFPILAITPSTIESVDNALSLGAIETIREPVHHLELQHRLERVIELRRVRKELDRNGKQLERVTRIGDKQQDALRILNNELDIYKNHLEERVEETTKEIKSLYREIEDTQKELIFTMGAIGESRSKETGNHVNRVAEYTYLLAIDYGISKSESEILKQASPMHDIGKVAIPDRILNKPGRLTDDEFSVMREHAKLGYDMLKHSNRTLIKAASIVAHQHHEKWDGSGYPQRLKGEDIHIYGRITAVADVFDALGSDRIYKKAWSDDKIIEHFIKNKGSHFDPKLIDLFLRNLKKIFEIRDRFKD